MFSNFYIKQRLAKRDLLLAAGKNPYDNVSARSIKNAEFLEKYRDFLSLKDGGESPNAVIASEREARSEPRSINSVEPGRHVKDGFDKWIATPPTAARNDESQVDSTPTETIAGRVKFMRLMGKAAFIKIEDESAILQAYASASDLGNTNSVTNTTESATDSATNANTAESNATLTDFDLVKKIIEVGDIIEVSGFPFVTKSGELSIHATRIKVLTKSIVPLPEKFHGLSDIELRYRQRYVDLIANADVREVFKLRSRIISLTRRFFEDKGFLEVETPMLHPIPGGANARPFITHYNALGEERYLRIAPELYLKRLIVGGFEAVFEINRNFRNEGMDHTHNPEFSMIEFYWAYRRFGDLIALTKELFFYLLDALNLGREIEWDGMKINFNDFRAIPLKESLTTIGGLESAVVNDPKRLESAIRAVNPKLDSGLSYGKLLGEAFDEFVEAKLINPTFITDYPIEISPLARRSDADSSIADRFELFIGGKEIANGFSELNDPLDQLARFKEQVAAKEKGDEEAQYMDEDFVWALGHGMPPTAGQGIGIDRLVMLLSGQKSIKDVILFPAMRTGRVADLESAQDSKRDSKQESAQVSKQDSAKDSKK